MSLTSPAFATNQKGLRKTYLWVTAWLIAGAVLAILLLANSIRDYQLVSKIIDTEQVRYETNQHVAALEQRLRLNALGTGPRLKSLIDDLAESGDRPAWIELRASDGSLLRVSGKQEGHRFPKKRWPRTSATMSHSSKFWPLLSATSSWKFFQFIFPQFQFQLIRRHPQSVPPQGQPLYRRWKLRCHWTASFIQYFGQSY